METDGNSMHDKILRELDFEKVVGQREFAPKVSESNTMKICEFNDDDEPQKRHGLDDNK